MKTIKSIYVYLFIVILGVLVIPQFSLKIGENTFTYPNIDFTFINPNATLGNFTRGYGIYDSIIYSSLVNLDPALTDDQKEEALKSVVSVVKLRVATSNLRDVEVFGSSDQEGYKINLRFPQHIQESDKIASFLVAQGVINFEADPQVSQSPISLSDQDIVGEIRSIFDEQYGSVLAFKFSEDSQIRFLQALENPNNYFLMRVDTSFFAVLRDPNYTRTQSLDLATSAIAIPFADIKLSPNVALYTNIVRSYFLTPPLNEPLVISPISKLEARDYVADRVAYVGLLIVFAIFATWAMFSIRNGKDKAYKLGLILLSYLLLTTFILKLQSAPISIGLILGFVISYLLTFFIFSRIIQGSEESQSKRLKEVLPLFLFLTFVGFILFTFVSGATFLTDLLGVLMASSLSAIFVGAVNARFIIKFSTPFISNKK